MFRRRKNEDITSSNPEVQEAMDMRDARLGELRDAVEEADRSTKKVDRLQSALLEQYIQADKARRG